MIKTIEIYFRDLIAVAQYNLLKEFDTTVYEENWDIFPIAVMEREVASPVDDESVISDA